MSTNDVQKTERAKWTQEDLTQAINAVNEGFISSRAASIEHGVPRTTLERHLKLGNKEKKRQGRTPVLGRYEKELEEFLFSLQNDGIKWTVADLRRIAFEFAEKCDVKHHFNKEKRLANYNWVNSFLNRHPRLSAEKGVRGVLCMQETPPKPVPKYVKYPDTQNVDNRCQWTEDQLIQAIDSVNNGTESHRSASKKFGIPRTTLIRHIKEGSKEKKRLGRVPIMGDLETKLTDFLLSQQNSGVFFSITDIRQVAFNFAKLHNVNHKFNKQKGLASYEWVHAFISRHPEVAVRTRKECSRMDIYEFGDMLQIILEEGDGSVVFDTDVEHS